VLLDRFDPAAGLRLIADTGVTTVAAAPSQFAAWAAQPGFAAAFAGVRWAMSGSAPLPPELVAGYAGAGVPLYQGYGLTEAAPVLTTNVASGKPGSIGRPLPGVDLKLCDHHGEVTEEDDPGEILVRGDNLFSGYWPDGRDGPDEDGWFATGDIAVTDADGDLRIVGRVHDMVLVNGFNVYPAEVEAALTRIPGVAEAAVTGEPDPVTGEAVVAYVLPDAAGGLTEQDVRAGLSGSLARFKQPRRIEIVRQFPHTVTGKVQKWRLTGDRVGNGAA
jgi:long-chain acyl-CoA synthetase